jgi:hypothetical protein
MLTDFPGEIYGKNSGCLGVIFLVHDVENAESFRRSPLQDVGGNYPIWALLHLLGRKGGTIGT